MSNHEAAKTFLANMTAMRQGKITADEFRARNRAMREELGEVAYTAAKNLAICSSNR